MSTRINRFSALKAKTWLDHGGGFSPRARAPGHVSAAGRALGLLLSRALSSRLPKSILRLGETTSSIRLLVQQIVDLEVLLHEPHTALDGMSGCLRRKALEAAVADTVILAEIAINGFETVVGRASNFVGTLSAGVAQPANNPLMSDPRSDIVKRGTPRDDGVGGPLMFGQDLADVVTADMKHLCDVAVREQAPLRVSLLAQTASSVQQPFGCRQAVDAPLHVVGRGEVEEDGDEFGIGERPVSLWRVFNVDGRPERLSVCDVVARPHVLLDHFHNQFST